MTTVCNVCAAKLAPHYRGFLCPAHEAMIPAAMLGDYWRSVSQVEQWRAMARQIGLPGPAPDHITGPLHNSWRAARDAARRAFAATLRNGETYDQYRRRRKI